jgi:DNA-directed RNA polymerase subunit RPC12/RpoP
MSSKQTLVTIKRCSQCKTRLPEDSQAHKCPYCGGPIMTTYSPLLTFLRNRIEEARRILDDLENYVNQQLEEEQRTP